MNELPRPNPQVLALVEGCNDYLRRADVQELRRAFQSGQQGPQITDEPTPQQLQDVYDTAQRLCDEGNFRFAAPLALHLVTYKPGDMRFSFLAGACMQHLGMHASAARFYCYTLVNGGDNAMILYRLAECLVALGDGKNAEKALDAAVDVAREVQVPLEVTGAMDTLFESLRKDPQGTQQKGQS
jgi:predicted Zn-dependent protease